MGEIRQPGDNMKSLYDVFTAIRADEGDHVGTMKACLDPNVAVNSPSMEKRILTGVALAATFGYLLSTGDMGDVDGMTGMSDLIDGTTEDGTASFIEALMESIFGGAAFSSVVAKEVVDEDLMGSGFFTTVFWGEIREFLIDVLEKITRL